MNYNLIRKEDYSKHSWNNLIKNFQPKLKEKDTAVMSVSLGRP